jgi:hypothetical protein
LESIRIEVARRNDAQRLDEALWLYDSAVRRTERTWEISVSLERQSTALLIHLFHVLGEWLVDCGLASCRVFFGDRDFVFVVPVRGAVPDARGFLLERVIQLQSALEERDEIGRATGFVAARLDISVDDAFALLRVSAQSEGVAIAPLARRIVAERVVPAAVASRLAP